MMYRNSAQGEKRYESDKYYVENLSFALDLKVFFKTILKVIKKENIYNNTDTDRIETVEKEGEKIV